MNPAPMGSHKGLVCGLWICHASTLINTHKCAIHHGSSIGADWNFSLLRQSTNSETKPEYVMTFGGGSYINVGIVDEPDFRKN